MASICCSSRAGKASIMHVHHWLCLNLTMASRPQEADSGCTKRIHIPATVQKPPAAKDEKVLPFHLLWEKAIWFFTQLAGRKDQRTKGEHGKMMSITNPRNSPLDVCKIRKHGLISLTSFTFVLGRDLRTLWQKEGSRMLCSLPPGWQETFSQLWRLGVHCRTMQEMLSDLYFLDLEENQFCCHWT